MLTRSGAEIRWATPGRSGRATVSPAEYVNAAPLAIQGNTARISLDGPLVVDDIAATEWLNDEHKAAHAAEGTHAMLAMPLRHRGEVLGTLVFYSRRSRSFGEFELRAASATASLAAAAIGTARVYEEQARLAEDRRLIVEASEQLTTSLDYETTLATLADLVVPTLADWCVVDVVAPDGSIERLAVAHRDPARVEQAKRLIAKLPVDPSSPRGVPSAIRTQEPVLVAEICEAELEERYADRPTLLAELRGLGLRSYMTVPLVARGVSLGAITFVAAESGRTYGEADLTLAQELARRAAIAVDNALLYRDAILNESQVRFLAEADSVLNESLDYDTTLASLARLAVPQVADWCIVDIVEGAEIRRVAVAAADEEKQRALEEPPAGLPADVGLSAAGGSGAPTGRRRDPRGVRPPGARRHRRRRPAPRDPRGARSAFGHRPAADRARRDARRDHLRLVADPAPLQPSRPAADRGPRVQGRARGRQRPPVRPGACDGQSARVPRAR